MAAMAALEAEGVDVTHASFVAGHSLGEYSALCAAGVFSLADTARLLRARGLAMQSAVPVGEGAMAAVLGLGAEAVTQLAEDAAQGDVCQLANENDPTQNVISGSKAAVERAIAMAKDAGAKRALPLPVSAPFHCALMQPAADEMAQALAEVNLQEPRVPIVSNVTASSVETAAPIVDLLVQQITGRVRWMTSVEWMVAQGVTEFWEIGAGKALSGMIRRIHKDATLRNVGAAADVTAALKG
jgi:[acyl-carrier-protein] S-malonyltransferase